LTNTVVFELPIAGNPAGMLTVTGHVAKIPPSPFIRLIFVVPGDTAETLPSSATRAISSLSALQD
jgi:hypothetical protein